MVPAPTKKRRPLARKVSRNTWPKNIQKHFDEIEDELVRRARERIRSERRGVEDGEDDRYEDVEELESETEAELRKELDELRETKKRLEADLRKTKLPGSAGGSREKYNYGRAFVAAACARSESDFERMAPYEWECHKEHARALGTTPDIAGGFVVPGEVHTENILEPFKTRVFVFKMGVQIIDASTTPFEIPSIESEPDADGANENEDLPEGDFEFGNRRAEPHDCGIFITAPKRFMRMAAQADTFIQNAIRKKTAIKLQRWILKGAGNGVEPTGMLNTSGIQQVDLNAAIDGSGIPTADYYRGLMAMRSALVNSFALDGAGVQGDDGMDSNNFGWVFSTKGFDAVQTIHSDNNAAGTSNLEFQRKVLSEGPSKLVLDYPFKQTPIFTDGDPAEIMLAGFEDVMLINFAGFRLEASSEGREALRKRQVYMAGWSEVDVLVGHPEAIVEGTNLDTSNMP